MKTTMAVLAAAACFGCVAPGYHRYGGDRYPVYGYDRDYRYERDYREDRDYRYDRDSRYDRDYDRRAEGYTAGERQQNQRNRIENGVDSGNLTRKEAQGLRKQQRNVKHMRQDARDDGVVTSKERKQIRRAQDKAGDRIYDQKHDDQTR